MPLKKLSEIEEKLNKDYLNIKNRFVRLKFFYVIIKVNQFHYIYYISKNV